MMRQSVVGPAARRTPSAPLCRLCAFTPGSASVWSRPLHLSASAKPRRASPIVAPQHVAASVRNVALGRGVIVGNRRYQSSTTTEAVQARTEWSSQSQAQSQFQGAPEAAAATPKDLPDLQKLANLVRKSKDRFVSTDGIPTPQLVLAALRTCQGAADALHPYLTQSSSSSSRSGSTASTASHLLSLDSNTSESGTAKTASSQTATASAAALLRNAVDCVSESAFAIVAHPPVLITPEVLELFVNIQARLGRPETLPSAFELYASKPQPRVVAGSIDYVPQNPNRADKAVEAAVAKTGLGVAIEAKNLDAALGVIEGCYTTQAFVRQKLLKQAFLPLSVLGATPFAVYALSSALSAFQNTVEPSTATKCAFAGIVAYLGFTSTIGLVAKVTTNDHMKRVTWAPGIPLHQRWVREEERAALDDVACAWGFKEKWRHGEEGGVEWESLREYVGLKGMILDRVEFMEGMS